MDRYIKIEKLIADQYGKTLGRKKSTGDFMLTESHAVNVKSNNIDKQNYSPNMISIKKMHEWVFEQRRDLSFVFVDYREQQGGAHEVLLQTELIPIEQISWDCLSIEAQGYGVIQMNRTRKIVPGQTKAEFYKGFLSAYKKYQLKEAKKHEKFAKRFLDPSTIDW
jgi:hypothetical protein